MRSEVRKWMCGRAARVGDEVGLDRFFIYSIHIYIDFN